MSRQRSGSPASSSADSAGRSGSTWPWHARWTDRQLRPSQALASVGALLQGLIVRQELDHAVEPVLFFQGTHVARQAVQQVGAELVGHGDRLGLQVVVAQHKVGDLVGHLLQQLVALLAGHVAGLLHGAQQDLDVDLVVRAIDARRVVDGIRVAAPAGHVELDARPLGQAQVGALADDLGADLGGVDPQVVVGPVAGVGMGLAARLHVGADAAEPQELDRRLQHG